MSSSAVKNDTCTLVRKLSTTLYTITILYTNIQSLTSKLDLFTARVNSRQPTLIIVTETWLKPNIPDSMINLPGYDLYRDDRINKRSGGVAIYAAKQTNLMNTKLNINYNKKYDDSECLWLDITIGNNKFLLCRIYRGHNSTLEQDNTLLDQLNYA